MFFLSPKHTLSLSPSLSASLEVRRCSLSGSRPVQSPGRSRAVLQSSPRTVHLRHTVVLYGLTEGSSGTSRHVLFRSHAQPRRRARDQES